MIQVGPRVLPFLMKKMADLGILMVLILQVYLMHELWVWYLLLQFQKKAWETRKRPAVSLEPL